MILRQQIWKELVRPQRQRQRRRLQRRPPLMRLQVHMDHQHVYVVLEEHVVADNQGRFRPPQPQMEWPYRVKDY